MANFYIPSEPFFTKFYLLKSLQRGESEFDIIINIYSSKLSD